MGPRLENERLLDENERLWRENERLLQENERLAMTSSLGDNAIPVDDCMVRDRVYARDMYRVHMYEPWGGRGVVGALPLPQCARVVRSVFVVMVVLNLSARFE